MSEFSVIHDVTVQLRNDIFNALQTTADTDFGLGGEIERITLGSPAAEVDDDCVASLYLYRFGVNPSLRNQQAQPDRNDPALFHYPPLPLQLHYLFTPLLEDERTNLLLLGRVLQYVLDTPIVRTLNGELIDDSHGAAPRVLRQFPEELELEHLNGLWAAFTTALRLGAGLRVETVAIDSALPPRQLARAMQLIQATGLREDRR